MSYNILSGIRKGERDAKAAERAKRAGARAGRGGHSKSGFSRSAGRAAVGKMQIRGRGIAAEVWKNGRSFKNRIDYALNKEKGAELIFANTDLRSMRAAAKLRPDIKEPVGHISMSLPPSSGKRTKEEWAELVETARLALGLDDSFPLIVARHNDTDHDHIHLVFSRISVTGKCHDQANLGLKCAAVERILEDKHSLKLTPPSEFKSHNSKTTKNEIEMGLRTHRKPPRLLISDALKIAVQGKPTTAQFVERLNAAGVGVKANVASTGRMNGFSFVYDGVAFGASKISKEYGWKQLSEVIDYDQTRDLEFVAQLDGNTGDASRALADANSIVSEIHRAVGAVTPATPDAGGNLTDSAAERASAADRAVQRDPEEGTAAPSRATATPQSANRGFEKSEIDVVHIDRHQLSADPDLNPDLSNPSLINKGEKHEQINNSTNAASGGSTPRRRTSWRTSASYFGAPQRLTAVASKSGMRTLSDLPVVSNAKRGEVLLPRNAPAHLDNLRADPDFELRRPAGASAQAVVPQDRTSAPPARRQPSPDSSTAKAAIRGFARTAVLDHGLRGWAGGLHCRLVRARALADQKQLQRALYDARDRMTAIATDAGYSVPEPKHLSDEQIVALVEDLGGDQSAVEIKGNPDFCERVERVANDAGLKIRHEYQVSEAERKAAAERWEQKQKEDERNGQSNLPTFSPK